MIFVRHEKGGMTGASGRFHLLFRRTCIMFCISAVGVGVDLEHNKLASEF